MPDFVYFSYNSSGALAMTPAPFHPADVLAELTAPAFAFVAFLVRGGERVALRGTVIALRDVQREAAWRGQSFSYLLGS